MARKTCNIKRCNIKRCKIKRALLCEELVAALTAGGYVGDTRIDLAVDKTSGNITFRGTPFGEFQFAHSSNGREYVWHFCPFCGGSLEIKRD